MLDIVRDSRSARVILALADAFEGDTLPPFSTGIGSLVIATSRARGRAVERSLVGAATFQGALGAAIRRLDLEGPEIDAVELNLCHSLRHLPDGLEARALDKSRAGLLGYALLRQGEVATAIAPTELIAANRSPRATIDWALETIGATPEAITSGEITLAAFETEQYLCQSAGSGVTIRSMFRAARPLDLSPPSRRDVVELTDGMTTWMLNQVQPDGRMVYLYRPSRSAESDGDNTIRQAMATICLGRIARRSPDPDARARANRNLDHLVATYYRENGPHGLAIEGDKVKLGGIALTALAIIESPQRDRYASQLARLIATTNFLQNPDGGFRTFYAPVDRNDCQNFYPGETLLLWASALKAGIPGVTRGAYIRAFRYYRDFFRADPNPAFVPWHSQAHYVVRDIIADPELDAFVFEMNDWLLSMQQWDSAPYADLRGRFYDPARPQYGKSHASATGVYLEGLIDALELARLHGDQQRALNYRRAILRGAQNLARLQFRTDEDMFYVRDPIRVQGGIRTEVYNSEIRVDNVQHGLMALQRVLERFGTADYKLDNA